LRHDGANRVKAFFPGFGEGKQKQGKEKKTMGKLYVVHNDWIRNPETGKIPYKIGITKNTIKTRFRGFKMPDEFECDLAYEFDDKKSNALLEKAIQDLLNSQRINGEWFNCNDKTLNAIAELCENFGGTSVDEIENFNETEKVKNNDSIFLLAQEKIDTILFTLTKKHKLRFRKKMDNKLSVIPIPNKFRAKLECNIYHPYNKRVDLEFICRDGYKFPKIKNFIKKLNGSNINGHKFKVCKNNNKIYHIFDYEDPTILETFLELLDFISDKMGNSQFFASE
jgi:hypothetical protein